MAEERFGALMGALDAPMAVVTTTAGGERGGCLIGFHAQSSIDPARYTVWLSKANHTYRLVLRASHLAVHFLAAGDHELARLFGTLSGDEVDKLERCDHREGPGGVPMLTTCPNRLVVARVALLDEGGDHVCVTGDVIDVHSSGSFEPLRLSDVSDLDAGHEAEERPAPPTERAASTPT